MKFEFSRLIPAAKEHVWRIAQNTALRPSWDVRVCEYIVHGVPAAGTPISIRFRALLRLRQREQILPLRLLKLAVYLDTSRSLRRLRKLCLRQNE